MGKTRFFALFLAISVSACSTAIGKPNEAEYAKYNWHQERPRVVNVHVYLDHGVSQERARELLGQWQEHEAKLYGLELNTYGFEEVPRKFGLFHNSIMDQVAAIPLKGGDDRVFYFAGHGVQDVIYSYLPIALMIPPEILGEVDDQTMTHGWAWASVESIPSLLMPPADATTHEFYHLIGSCLHGDDMATSGCYERISSIKQANGEDGFFPTMSRSGHLYHSRAEVNAALAGWSDPLSPFADGEKQPMAAVEDSAAAVGGGQQTVAQRASGG